MMKSFTTSQVAYLLEVKQSLVIKWFDEGDLHGYLVPNSTHRRIPLKHLARFVGDHADFFGDAGRKLLMRLKHGVVPKVMVIAKDPNVLSEIQVKMGDENSFEVMAVPNSFEAGFQFATFNPDCVILDFSIGRYESVNICRALSKKACDAILIALLPDDGFSIKSLRLRADAAFRKPLNANTCVNCLRQFIKEREIY